MRSSEIFIFWLRRSCAVFSAVRFFEEGFSNRFLVYNLHRTSTSSCNSAHSRNPNNKHDATPERHRLRLREKPRDDERRYHFNQKLIHEIHPKVTHLPRTNSYRLQPMRFRTRFATSQELPAQLSPDDLPHGHQLSSKGSRRLARRVPTSRT